MLRSSSLASAASCWTVACFRCAVRAFTGSARKRPERTKGLGMSSADMDVRTNERLTEAARACRILEMEGHGDMTLGHLSVRESGGRGLWMKRNRIGLGEVTGPDDFVLIDWDGRQIAGSGGRHSEWPIHSEILRARPDVHVVAHSHPFYASVFSAADEPLLPYTLDADYFIDIPRHQDE